jgi:hypothetical protein
MRGVIDSVWSRDSRRRVLCESIMHQLAVARPPEVRNALLEALAKLAPRKALHTDQLTLRL